MKEPHRQGDQRIHPGLESGRYGNHVTRERLLGSENWGISGTSVRKGLKPRNADVNVQEKLACASPARFEPEAGPAGQNQLAGFDYHA